MSEYAVIYRTHFYIECDADEHGAFEVTWCHGGKGYLRVGSYEDLPFHGYLYILLSSQEKMDICHAAAHCADLVQDILPDAPPARFIRATLVFEGCYPV